MNNREVAREMFLRCVEVINGIPVINLGLAAEILTKARKIYYPYYTTRDPFGD